jgi:hypothetical protein
MTGSRKELGRQEKRYTTPPLFPTKKQGGPSLALLVKLHKQSQGRIAAIVPKKRSGMLMEKPWQGGQPTNIHQVRSPETRVARSGEAVSQRFAVFSFMHGLPLLHGQQGAGDKD